MKKIVINKCYGGFDLSDDAVMRYGELAGLNLVKFGTKGTTLCSSFFYEKGIEDYNHCFYARNLDRDDEYLVQVVEEMGELANGNYAKLKVVEIPNDAEWQIEEYDGIEWIAEKHRTWE